MDAERGIRDGVAVVMSRTCGLDVFAFRMHGICDAGDGRAALDSALLVKKATPAFCARRNLSRVKDGALT